MVILGMVALFNVLMQKFYKVTQGNHKKVPSFTTRLEGTLNQLQLKCPRWIADCEVPWCLKDCLFHGVHKHIRYSIKYSYSNPETTYSQLMVVACKAESKIEEAKEKVKARSAVTTDLVDSSKELSNQIAKLMAALTRAEQSNHPLSAPNSPRHRACGRGWMDGNTPTHPNSLNGWTGLGQTTSAHSSSTGTRTGNVPQGKGNTQGSTDGQGSVQNMKDPNLLQCFRCQGWGHMARKCTTQAKTLNRDRGN